MMKLLPVSVATFLLLGTCTAAAQKTMITGRVVDQDNASVQNARVVFHPNDSSLAGRDVTLKTNVWGGFSANLKSGTYDVFVSAPGAIPFADKTLLAQGDKPLQYRVVCPRPPLAASKVKLGVPTLQLALPDSIPVPAIPTSTITVSSQ